MARLGELRLSAIEQRAQALIGLGRPGEVIGQLESEIAAEPFRERLRAVLMSALARAGRPVEALARVRCLSRAARGGSRRRALGALQALNDDILFSIPTWVGNVRPVRLWSSRELPSGTVTFLFTDLEGSTRLWQEHPDTMGIALARHDAILRDAVESHEDTS